MTIGRLVLLLFFVTTNLDGPDARGKELLRWETKVAPNCLAVTPDGQSVCMGGRSPYIFIWDIESGELRTRLLATRDNALADQAQEVEDNAEEAPQNSPDMVDAIAISPDGKLLAAVVVTRERETDTREYLSLWDLATESQIAFAKLPNLSEVTDAIIDEKLRQMRAAGITGLVGGGGVIMNRLVRSVAFAPGGKHIAASGAYASRVWDLDAAEFLPGFKPDARLC